MPLTMPDIHAAIQILTGFKMFGECDWTTAFHQVPLDEITSQRLSTPCGLFAPNFLPEGVAVGSALLMQAVYTIFADFDK